MDNQISWMFWFQLRSEVLMIRTFPLLFREKPALKQGRFCLAEVFTMSPFSTNKKRRQTSGAPSFSGPRRSFRGKDLHLRRYRTGFPPFKQPTRKGFCWVVVMVVLLLVLLVFLVLLAFLRRLPQDDQFFVKYSWAMASKKDYLHFPKVVRILYPHSGISVPPENSNAQYTCLPLLVPSGAEATPPQRPQIFEEESPVALPKLQPLVATVYSLRERGWHWQGGIWQHHLFYIPEIWGSNSEDQKKHEDKHQILAHLRWSPYSLNAPLSLYSGILHVGPSKSLTFSLGD